MMKVQIPCNAASDLINFGKAKQIVSINVKSHHRYRGKWKVNEWYEWYKKFPHKERTLFEIDNNEG